MIQINPLKSYIDGGVRAAITTPPSASLVFDLPGKAIWVKGVKLKGTDHTYTFSHDNYITLTNTPDSNESEDIKIGVNTNALKSAIDTTYGVVSTTTNGLAPKFTSGNKLAATAATTYYFLGWTGTTLKWYQAPFRNIRINSETTDRLGVNSTDPLIISSGNGISVTWDSTNKKIVITNTKPDVNHNTDRTGIKLATVSGTKKTDSTLILANSATGLNIQGGTNKFLIGNGTNYIEVPITPSFTIINKDATIGTALTTIATIAGIDIKAKIASYSLSNHTHSVKINGSTKTIAASGAVDLGNYLPLSGGTMSGSIYIPKSATIIHTTNSTSNWVYISELFTGSSKSATDYQAGIGWHNTGGNGNGALTLIPYAQNSDPWGGNVGLYIAQNSLKFNGTAISLVDHTHAWNSLIHSSTTLNQAILTNGSANGWKLYTLNISGWNNAANNAHSHSNKSVLDGITSGLVNNWNTAYNFVNIISGTDTDKVINKWDEIVNFLAGISEDDKLNTLLNNKLSILLLSTKDILTTKTNNALFWVNTKGTASSITTGPFTDHPYALLSVTNYSQNDTNGKFFYRSRLAFSSTGDIKVASCHHENVYKLDETWYNILTSKNSGISGSTIKLNGTSITVYSSSAADSRFVKKAGDTMSGALTINTTGFGALIIKRNDDANGASIQFRGKSNVYGYIGLNNSTKDKLFLRWNSDTSKTYIILDTSSTYVSGGKGIINSTTITQVDNATNATNSTNSTNARKLINWYSTRPTSLNTQFGDGSLRIFHATSSTTEGKSPTDATVLHLAWDNNGGWDTQLAINSSSCRIYSRGQNSGTWQSWKTLAFTTDIPASLKNPYSLTIFGVVYDGSAAKTVTTSTFISLVTEGTSTITDGTMFITSYVSNSGFADTNAVNVPYKRKAIHLWEYIKVKTDSLYATKSHNHDDRYVRAFGTSNDNIDSDWGQSFKTFDPIPSGTPPELNPNISILNIGNNFNRRKLLAFIYNNDNIYYRRHVDNGFTNWVKLLHTGNSNVSGGGNTWGSSITVNINGISKTLTIPGNPNTDYRVTQSETTTANYRPLVLGYTNVSIAGSGMAGSVTNQVYLSNKFYVQPSTGNLYATNFVGTLSGNASSANKLTTARNIALGTDLRGSANFNGSSNITISANINACTVQVSSTNGLPFKRIAHFETGSSWNDNALLLYISLGYINGSNGICRVEFRTDNISSGSTSVTASAAVRWLVRNGYSLDSLYVGYYVTTSKAYIDIYLKTTGGYQGTVIRVLLDSRGSINSNVLLINSYYYSDTNHKEAYNSIEAASTALYNRAYTRIVSGSDVGTVSYSNSTGSVHWNNVTNKPSTFAPTAHTHTVFNNNLMIKGTNGVSDSASIHLGIGDSDTGFKWISDGKCLIYSNNTAVGEWTSGGMNWFKNPTVNGNKIWNAGNDGSGSGLDADTVDGYHASSFLIDRGGNYTGLLYDLPCKSIFSGSKLSDAPVTNDWVSGIVLGSNWNSSHYLHYLVESGSRWYATRAYSDGKMTKWNTFAYLTDNVASATKLQTARKIWGQSFNGTGDVNGSLSGVGHILFSADNTYNIGSNSAASKYIYTNWLGAKSGLKLELGANNSNFGLGLCINTNLNVGIGTNTPAYKLHVTGDIYTTTGFKKNGSSNSYVLLGGGSHKAISDFMLKTDELSNNLTTISKSLTVTQAWMDTGIKNTNLPANGTYIIQVSANNTADSIWSNYWSGIMSWYTGGTNDSETDEIILHRAGHAYHHTIYLRTIMTTSSDGRHLRLQIAADTNLSTAVTYTFKFKRVI